MNPCYLPLPVPPGGRSAFDHFADMEDCCDGGGYLSVGGNNHVIHGSDSVVDIIYGNYGLDTIWGTGVTASATVTWAPKRSAGRG